MKILDVACGGRMMWFDKANPDVVFGDIRRVDVRLVDGRRFVVRPDVQIDFRALPFQDGVFQMVVFDPPHLKTAGPRSWQAAKYGKLSSTWRDDLKTGFLECWRVLAIGGTLIFKWNDYQIPISDVIGLAPVAPLFGHKTKATTKWFVFMKLPSHITPHSADGATAPRQIELFPTGGDEPPKASGGTPRR